MNENTTTTTTATIIKTTTTRRQQHQQNRNIRKMNKSLLSLSSMPVAFLMLILSFSVLQLILSPQQHVSVLVGVVYAFPIVVVVSNKQQRRQIIIPTQKSTIRMSDNDDYNNDDTTTTTTTKKLPSRWDRLNPKIKQRIIKEAQQRAIENKKKREPESVKKRRRYMFMKQKQDENKRASRVQRPLPFNQRIPLSVYKRGMEINNGVVISIVNYGVYVDIGTEIDGLLHISQISNTEFITHPKQVFQPGDVITENLTIRDVNPETKVLQLTMLPSDIVQEQMNDDDDDDNRITINELQIDDELWGVIKRVTDYGAYIDVGAVVDGFLHFMDHPLYLDYDHPTEYMKRGDRVRVWVYKLSEGDGRNTKNRIQLTATRPRHLPGPKREFFF